jgi:hypothetical protein
MSAPVAIAMPALLPGTLAARPQATSFNVAEPVGGPGVTAASVEMVTTYDQVVPGGKRMHSETHGKVYRDSQGRTRTESDAVGPAGTAQKFMLIFINDPVQHTMITLDPRTMTARVNPWLGARGLYSPLPGAPAPLNTSTTGAGGIAGAPSATAAAAPVDRATAATVLAAAVNTEDLGARDMEGVAVRGTKVTRTLTGSTGYRKRTVQDNRDNDMGFSLPASCRTERNGRHTVRQRATGLVNIVRSGPDAALFEIPAGYTVADNRAQK